MSLEGGEWISSLGRPFRLGSLYNFRDDIFFDPTSWSDKFPIETSQQIESRFEVIAEDSLSSVADRLEIKHSLRLKLYAGLINSDSSVSAKCLHDYGFCKQRAQVALRYSCTSHINQLNLDTLPNDSLSCLDVRATHVTTGILYGAEAIFLFHEDVANPEDYHTIYNQLQQKVVLLRDAIDTASNIDEMALIADEIHFKYYGDLPFTAKPANIKSVLEFCKSISLLAPIREDNPSVVPKQVCLHPLSTFGGTPKLSKEISADWVIQTDMFVQEVCEVETICSSLLKKEVSQYFSVIEKQISHFSSMITRHRKFFLDLIIQLLSKIHSGEEEETQLAKLFENYRNSPFYPQLLHSWLEEKECEVSLLAKCLEELSKIPGECLQVIIVIYTIMDKY